MAAAQDPAAKAQAVQLFDAADQLMAEGNISAACPKYAASMKLDPQLGALLHLADCYAKNGQIASAWGAFREAQEMAQSRGDERAAFAKEQASQLAPRLSNVTVLVPQSSNLPGLEVRIDGGPMGAGAWGSPTPIDAGSHGVEARAPGYETWSSSFNVTGDAQQVRVEIPVLTQSAALQGAGGTMPVTVQLDDTARRFARSAGSASASAPQASAWARCSWYKRTASSASAMAFAPLAWSAATTSSTR